MTGDATVIEREIQSRIDKAVAKKQRGVANGRGAYGRGAYAYGRGSYEMEPAVNSLFTNSVARRVHKSTVGDETGRVIVSRREYVMRVISPPTPGDFTVTSLNLNPGLSGVFAWLSQVAANYDEYEIKHLVFHFKPVISTASQSGSMGTVVMACNYNAGSVKFESFREMIEYEGAMETRICDSALFGIECDPAKGKSGEHQYVRAGAIPSDEDIKTYDLGLFQIATSDISSTDYPAGTLLGHLYVEYEVVLGKPKLFSALGKDILCDLFRCTSCSKSAPVSNVNSFSNRGNTLGGVVTAVTNAVRYIFPDNFSGTVLFHARPVGTMSSGDLAVDFIENGNVKPSYVLGSTGDFAEISTASPTSVTFLGAYDVMESTSANGNYIDISFPTVATFTLWSLAVTKTNPDMDHGWNSYTDPL